uniref:Uncharacterized protein n=1 Tax=Ananas comosus var. bracteatus TaxID=296719 RepID=A0A6V7P1B3_ANACO|nr:unnamed protein product [Ananas comosus var. bracteatus]
MWHKLLILNFFIYLFIFYSNRPFSLFFFYCTSSHLSLSSFVPHAPSSPPPTPNVLHPHLPHQHIAHANDDPSEAPKDSSHGLSRFQQLERHVERARRARTPSSGATSPSSSPPSPSKTTPSLSPSSSPSTPMTSSPTSTASSPEAQGVRRPRPPPPPPNLQPQAKEPVIEGLDELATEEVLDLDEIRELHGLTIISADGDGPPQPPSQGRRQDFFGFENFCSQQHEWDILIRTLGVLGCISIKNIGRSIIRE